jgi:hypothetical protein
MSEHCRICQRPTTAPHERYCSPACRYEHRRCCGVGSLITKADEPSNSYGTSPPDRPLGRTQPKPF